MNPDLMPAFALATLTFAVMPGPALLYTAAQTLARGRRAGLWAAAGIHAGGWVHVVAAAAGLSAVFRHAPELYLALKFAGAAYLLWLGATMLLARAEPDGDAAAAHAGARPARSARRAFVDSALVEVLNPKVALFFLAFLPQFVDPAAGWPVWAQFLALGALVNLAFSAADVVVVHAAAAITGAARRSAVGVLWTRRAGGAVLCGLGARLALARD